MPKKKGYDNPSFAGSTPMGRNKEITSNDTFEVQAHEAIERARKSAKGKLAAMYERPTKVVTDPPLSV